MKVKLSTLVEEVDMISEESSVFLDRESGETIFATDEEMRAVEDGDDEDTVEWTDEEQVDLLRAIIADTSDRFVPLPDRFEVHEWDIMRRFAESVDDDKKARELEKAIHGSKAFRRFKDTINDLGIQEDWYAFRKVWLTDLMRAWCEEHNIEFEEA